MKAKQNKQCERRTQCLKHRRYPNLPFLLMYTLSTMPAYLTGFLLGSSKLKYGKVSSKIELCH